MSLSLTVLIALNLLYDLHVRKAICNLCPIVHKKNTVKTSRRQKKIEKSIDTIAVASGFVLVSVSSGHSAAAKWGLGAGGEVSNKT